MKLTYKAQLVIVVSVFIAFVQAQKAMALGLADVQAQEVTIEPVGEPFHQIQSQKIDRVAALSSFFRSLNSPLEPYSADFVATADKYGLDYRLLPAISCNESSCGKYYIPSSNNVFGWGIYGNKVTSFESIEVGIDTVGKGLAQNYIARGYDTVEEIAPIYTPPNPTGWASKIRYFYNKIDIAAFEQSVNTIQPVSIAEQNL
jgi:hypothetical protein